MDNEVQMLRELSWKTSSYCTNSTCVQVGMTEDSVAIRDSKDLDQRPLKYTRDEWRQFIAGVKDGEFDLA
ncbi:DUF397 domain-containing protein [Paractinoplanes durhamensis]|uniref:DUF397 domain-containing protein n=1 Tax=Paractinoplanes durhamensis TaxID=113563 RepID=A0ABQ3Z7V1_9ACTN|nr:DUF397 domain-containing protein [Actinoplanes durhamensis]GIE05895.1 hypothetical protein Adu01nite_72450 [Actinoplanes durhamensis]